MKRYPIPVLAPEALVDMQTKQLLGRLRSLHQCEESAVLSDRPPEEVAASEGILFKNTIEWQRAYTDLKTVLATREHAPTAAERAIARQQRTQKRSNKRAGGDGATALLRRGGRRAPRRASLRTLNEGTW